jgi:1,4-alpha-glucan branching enzyme
VNEPVVTGEVVMGSTPHEGGVAFRVWAPHADRVFVTGTFNNWTESHPMQAGNDGMWYVDVPEAKIGDEYRYLICRGDQKLSRIDPHAREVTSSVGNGNGHDPHFDWEDDHYQLPPWPELVLYEMHIGTFHGPLVGVPGTYATAVEKFDHLQRLGVNVIEVMPTAEFAGNVSWGYNPAYAFAVETAYGGPRAFKQFVKAAHQAKLGVVLDVVYNHFGPGDLGLWQFDGWSENSGGGIYFYNDWRSKTPWGANRPDYGRGEVRQFIHDNAFFWLNEFHLDGLRFDMTLFMRTVDGTSGHDLPDGWSLTQWINRDISGQFPGRITIAEDLQNNEWLTRQAGAGGAGFGAQWDANFVHPIRKAVIGAVDEHRSLASVRDAIVFTYNGDAFQRVIYSESHDEVANGKSRVPSEISAADPESFFAQKRSTLAAGLVFTAPGIPMLFQGQEFLQGGWFQDTVPLDWHLSQEFRGILRLYRDLVRLRLNRAGVSRGLSGRGVNVYHVNEETNLLAFHRWDKGGPGDDVVVVANFENKPRENYAVGFPKPGLWRLRLNSDWRGYSDDFTDFASHDVTATAQAYDGCPAQGCVEIGPYSILILSQDPQPAVGETIRKPV